MKVNFNEKKQSFIVYNGKYSFTYSVSKFGKYAEVMAEYSAQTGERVNNWFEEKGEYVVIFAFYKPEGEYKEILVDKKDFEKVRQYYWGVDKHRSEYYAHTNVGTAGKDKTKLRMHRLIADPKDGEVVDHIKGNGLDNRRSNLRNTTVKVNNLNRVNASKNNKSGMIGVHKHKGYWTAQWREEDRSRQKCFSIEKYGEEAAKEKAIRYRRKMEKLHYQRV